MTLIFMMMGFTLVNIFTSRAKALTENTESKMDDQLLPIVSRMGKMAIIIISTFYILDLLNVNVTALIAGISIGGLALALAAKDTVQNLFGSAMIFIDRPFQVGDYIIAGGHEGTVVEVGFRSTRIMNIDTSIVSIPNGAMADMPLTNLGVRLSRLFNITIGVTYETPPDLIQAYIDRLKKLILDHPKTNDDPFYVHLRELADSSINIMFRCQIQVGSFAEDVQIKEELLFSIIRIAEEMGVEFAYPTTTIHMAKND
jgi:MscS family membrane protein